MLKLVNELFATASSAELCSPEERPTFLDFDDFLRGSMSVKPWDVSPDLHRQWGTTLEADEIKRTLPLATEDHMPPLPVTSNESQSLLQPIELPTRLEAADRIRHEPKTTARKRWCWAISRTIILARQRRCPHTRPFPRVERESPPTNVCTKWESIKFDQDTTARLLRFCKVNAQSPSEWQRARDARTKHKLISVEQVCYCTRCSPWRPRTCCPLITRPNHTFRSSLASLSRLVPFSSELRRRQPTRRRTSPSASRSPRSFCQTLPSRSKEKIGNGFAEPFYRARD